jgi:hypothetical protein
VESLLQNALAHALKIVADPESLSAEHWHEEVRLFLHQARAKIRPAMRSRIDMEEIWIEAREEAKSTLEAFDRSFPGLPDRNPFSFDDVRDSAFDPVSSLKTVLGRKRPQS